MSIQATSLFRSSSLLAVLLSVIAIYIASQSPTEGNPPPITVQSNHVDQLEKTIANLRDELITLQFRLDGLEELELARGQESTPPEAEVVESSADGELDGRIIAAVDRVMVAKGLEFAKVARQEAEEQQQQKKLNQTRDGFSSWVDNGRAKLPNLYNRIRDELELAPQTALEVEEILENGFQTMSFLTEQLYTDPPPEQAEALAIMGEVKGEAGSIIEELDEILTPEEMIALGQVYSEEVDPRLGQGFITNGNQGDDEDETQN